MCSDINFFGFFLRTTSNKLAKTVEFISWTFLASDFYFFENRDKIDTLFVMMTTWLVITRDPKLQQNAKMVKNVSRMLAWMIIFLLKKISRKNLFSLARTIGFSREAPFWARKFSIFRNHENRGAKNSKNRGFSRFLRKWCQIRFFSYFSCYFETNWELFYKKSFWPTLTDLEIYLSGGVTPPPRNHARNSIHFIITS